MANPTVTMSVKVTYKLIWAQGDEEVRYKIGLAPLEETGEEADSVEISVSKADFLKMEAGKIYSFGVVGTPLSGEDCPEPEPEKACPEPDAGVDSPEEETTWPWEEEEIKEPGDDAVG